MTAGRSPHSGASIIHPVYGVAGAEGFLRREVIEAVLKTLVDEVDSIGPTRFDGGEAQLAEVLDEVRTLSLLSGRRVAIVEEADSFISENRKALERYCSAPAEEGCLILSCNTLKANTRLCKIIGEHGKIIRCDPPKWREVTRWLIDRARAEYGKRLSSAAAEKLRRQVGDGLGTLDSELAKLTAYVGTAAEIAPEDVGALTGHLREEKVFAVINAMAAGETEAALRQWEQVLATDRAAPGRAIGGLAWGVRELLRARRDWERGADLSDLARRLFTNTAEAKHRLESVTPEQLENQQGDLLAADLAIKTGASTIGLAVEKFIVKHSTGASAKLGAVAGTCP